MNKLQTLKGFRDFLPKEVLERDFVIQKITKVFETYGFDPIQTPALEYAEVLMGKYGEDADRLIYSFDDRGGRKVGLRYDQTVPTARVVGQYTEELPRPFKRFQIQNVWRSENTQKGRYREFLQCDADIIGSVYPPLAEAETLSVFYDIYNSIGIKNLKILVNSRKVLRFMIEEAVGKKAPDDIFFGIVRSIDKLEKIGEDGVSEELLKKDISSKSVQKLLENIRKYSSYKITEIKNLDEDLYYSLQMAVENFNLPQEAIIFTPSLARGLDYYTGTIFEAISEGISGSLGGGGRYDNLIQQLGGPDTPAVGFAVGFDRTVELAREQGLIPAQTTVTKVFIAYIDDGEKVFSSALKLTGKLRSEGINTEIFLNPKESNIGKQLKYADKKGIPFAVIIGSEEVKTESYTLKDLKTGSQEKTDLDGLLKLLK